MTADNTAIREIAGGHRGHRPPLQFNSPTICDTILEVKKVELVYNAQL